MSIKRILVPLDGSKNSERGIEMAVDLANDAKRTIVGLYVKPTSVNSIKSVSYTHLTLPTILLV